MRQRFDQLDLDGNGHVTASELYLMFKALKVPVSQKTLDKLIKDADINANNEIEFDEFLVVSATPLSADLCVGGGARVLIPPLAFSPASFVTASRAMTTMPGTSSSAVIWPVC